ncbi:MAG: aspartate aminotransferase family protein [Woeseiaceae bacterium]
MSDLAFDANEAGLSLALKLLLENQSEETATALPTALPAKGIGEPATLETMAPNILGTAARLNHTDSFAHMDPPTPWISWAISQWTAALNQNLLHPVTAPGAIPLEQQTVAWLAPFFGMNGGHMTTGATLANLTAIWAARESAGVRKVVASAAAHLSIRKSAHLLGLDFQSVDTDEQGRMDPEKLPRDLSDACLVLTAGSTSTGSVDPLRTQQAGWRHIDAAWAGPLALSPTYADRLNGLNDADSVAVSAHKWLFQPKTSALVFFKDVATAHAPISFDGAYLASPNIGVLGSKGDLAAPLMATLMAWGRDGLVARIDHCMQLSEKLAGFINGRPELQLFAQPETGVVVWRGIDNDTTETLLGALPDGSCSTTTIKKQRWIRNVAANPNANVDALCQHILEALTS